MYFIFIVFVYCLEVMLNCLKVSNNLVLVIGLISFLIFNNVVMDMDGGNWFVIEKLK